MKPRTILLLLVAVVCGGLAAFLATQQSRPVQVVAGPETVVQEKKTQVLVAVAPIGVGQRLSAETVEWADWPAGAARPALAEGTLQVLRYTALARDTKPPAGFNVVTAEFKVNFMRPAIGERFLAIGKVQSAGKMLSVCTGEVRAFADAGDDYKVVALMQATVVNIKS